MAHTVEGKVAKILSDTHLIVNLGAMHGIRVGTVFTILAEGDEVTDPDSGEVLGNWEVPKGRVIATHVQDRLTTCESYNEVVREGEHEDPSTHVLSADMTRIAMRPETVSGKPPALNVNRGDIAGMPRIAPISVGDKVRTTSDLDQHE